MNKKQIHELIDGIVSDVMKTNNLSEDEARVFVGVALRNNRAAFLAAISIPKLEVAEPAAKAG